MNSYHGTDYFLPGSRINESDLLPWGHSERRFKQTSMGVDSDGEGMGLLAFPFANLESNKNVQTKHDPLTPAFPLSKLRVRFKRRKNRRLKRP